jgi:cytochrome c oxidase subunit II
VTDTAWVIAIGYAAFVIVGVGIALIIFRSTRVGFHVRTTDRETLERREGLWGLVFLAMLALLMAATIFSLPYWQNDEDNPQQLDITGRQFAFTVDPPRVRADVPTTITLRSADVNHAVGIYDSDDTLLKQVNVLPGVTQQIEMIFDHPGTYELRCLEFCGIDHHLMLNDLKVTR